MTKDQAKEYVNKRWTELPEKNNFDKVNQIIHELYQMGFTTYVCDEYPVAIKAVSKQNGEMIYYV